MEIRYLSLHCHHQNDSCILSVNDFLPGCLFAVVVIKCCMIGVNV